MCDLFEAGVATLVAVDWSPNAVGRLPGLMGESPRGPPAIVVNTGEAAFGAAGFGRSFCAHRGASIGDSDTGVPGLTLVLFLVSMTDAVGAARIVQRAGGSALSVRMWDGIKRGGWVVNSGERSPIEGRCA